MADLTPQAFDGMVLEVVAVPLKGNPGSPGSPGGRGAPGPSNYELWLAAGNTGSVDDFLEAQKGPQGEQGVSLTNRGEWSPNVYGPGDYVFAPGSTNDRSMWIVMSQDDFISQVEPRLEPSRWVEFSSQQGEPGVDGSLWFIRTTNPVAELGKTTDCWLNVTTGDVWQKTDVWGSPIGTLAGGGSGGGGVASVNDKTPDSNGNVTLTAADVGAATTAQGAKADTAVQPAVLDSAIEGVVDSLSDVAVSGNYNDLSNKPVLGSAAAANTTAFATAAQGAKADTAVQPGALAAVATSGAYGDLSGKPTLGSAAAQNSSAFATAAQGAKADTAVQANQLAQVAVSGNYNDLSNKPTLGTAASQPSTAFATAAQGAKADTAVQPGALAAVATSGSFNDLLNKPVINSAKNKLINGSMSIWQRGISFNIANAAAGYTADRWLFNTGAGANINVSRQALALGEVDQLTSAMAVAVSAVGGGVNMRQPIELVTTSANKTVTLSFWARANNAGASIGVRGQQIFGSGGSANTGLGGGGNVTLSTSYTRHWVTLIVPTIVGKTLGADSSVQLIFDFNTNNTTYYITGVQWEEGTEVTPFDYVMPGDELTRCMRFFEKSYDYSVYPGQASAFGRCGEFIGINPRNTATSLSVSFKVPKRVTSAINIYASENGQANAVSQASGTAVTINGISAVGVSGFQVTYTNESGQYGGSFHFTANAEF